MKKILLSLILITLFFISHTFADRNTATVSVIDVSQLVKRGDAKLYSITFVATSAGGNFIVYDATSATNVREDIVAEGSEATANNSQYQDFSNKPLEFSTGLYIVITTGKAIISYE